MSKKLTKSRTNKVLTGTLAGIAEYFGIDPTILRVIYVVIVLGGFGSPVLLYFILWLVIPKAPVSYNTRDYGANEDGYGKEYYYYKESKREGHPYYNRNQETKRKEAEKVTPDVKDADDDDWSDF